MIAFCSGGSFTLLASRLTMVKHVFSLVHTTQSIDAQRGKRESIANSPPFAAEVDMFGRYEKSFVIGGTEVRVEQISPAERWWAAYNDQEENITRRKRLTCWAVVTELDDQHKPTHTHFVVGLVAGFPREERVECPEEWENFVGYFYEDDEVELDALLEKCKLPPLERRARRASSAKAREPEPLRVKLLRGVDIPPMEREEHQP
jgi:hypothetical protein